MPIALAVAALDLAIIVSVTAQCYFKGIPHLVLALCSKTVDIKGKQSKQVKFEIAKEMLVPAVVGTGLLIISPLVFPCLAVYEQIQFLKERKS
ncbi:hypothetical protein PHSC3_000040 [Chlamydiales bacterium STE3]|nr:hypothetical protein PHSC3_000040 [Chlamydiales bacterium STE3]